MTWTLETLVRQDRQKLTSAQFRADCKRTLDRDGVLVLPDFLSAPAISAVQQDGALNQHRAYYTVDQHNVFLMPTDPLFALDHPRNRAVSSSKGCITTDQIPADSALHVLYAAPAFRAFVCAVLGESELHAYADPLSSVNLHYASGGQELGWHFDNSSFAITLLIQKPVGGGVFEYVKDVRDAARGESNFDACARILDGTLPTQSLAMEPGTLVLFRGRNAMHRVTPVKGMRTRMLVVLAYNTEPDVSLSESARMTFYGRLG